MNSKEIVESGLLELYALGTLEGDELDMVSNALETDPVLKNELNQVEDAIFLFAQAHAVTPNPTVKALLMGTVHYIERLKKGEVPAQLPVLNEKTRVDYFNEWLEREDMQLNADFNEAQVSIISQEQDKMTAIVWLKSGALPETHENEYEKFLIVEGTCDITIETTVHALRAGDYLSIPLYADHHVRVTSQVPCKIILQRVKC